VLGLAEAPYVRPTKGSHHRSVHPRRQRPHGVQRLRPAALSRRATTPTSFGGLGHSQVTRMPKLAAERRNL
jgi:hypothetical protein